MTDSNEKPKGKLYGGAGNPNRLTELRNMEVNSPMVLDGGYNPNRITQSRTSTNEAHNPTQMVDSRNQSNTHVAIFNPVTKKITLDGKEVNP